MAEAPWRQAAPPARLKSDVSDRRVEPPLCVQNAMLTKDKKPFTYTPGGIDLSEIRSPTMARRLERNAMCEGVGPLPQQQPHAPTGPLPPSALAAMQPQIQVQVFPSGGIPQPLHHHHGGGAPPPPPPPTGMPPPPPMRPTSPLPMDNFERPDMTKIIPENPMAMLRKTAGPVIKRDPVFNTSGGSSYADTPPARPPPQPVRQPEPVQTKTSTAGLGSIYVPPVNQNTTPPTPTYKQPQSPPFANQRSPPVASQADSPTDTPRAPPAYYKRQPSEPPSPPVTVQKAQPPQSPDSPKPPLSKAPTPWLTQKRQEPEVPGWAQDQRGKAPPAAPAQQVEPEPQPAQRPWAQQQPPQPQQQPQQTIAPPWRQQPQAQAQPDPQPWQRQQKQPEPQAWQQRPPQQPEPPAPQQQKQPQTPPWQQQQQQAKTAHSPPIQIPQGGGGVRKQVQNRDRPQEPGPIDRTEVVIVNEPPQVFHHPGQTQRVIIRQQPQQNNYQQESPGVRVIPVKMDGASSNGHARTPGSNSDARSLNRQQSWNANPTQSNTFRVLQKITNTDGDDDEDAPVIEHSPKTPGHFPQRQLSGDQELVHKFKQVPQGQQSNNRGPKVRTIPIQIEGDGPTKTYVPPSEQTVAEPKKYMGSSIPGRTFKILQAMTGPDDCANPARACENNENYPNDPSSYAQWGFDPNYPAPSPYYYNPYYYYPPTPTNEFPPTPTPTNNARMTPVPTNWGYYPYQTSVPSESDSDPDVAKKRGRTTPTPTPSSFGQNDNDPKKQNGNGRCTPVPYWPYYYPNYPSGEQVQEAAEVDANGNAEEQANYAQYPPYWDPYYYGYYYGAPAMYPPVYSPYPFYPPAQETEEVSGYSSTDEMAYYGARFASMPPFSNDRSRHVATPSLPRPASRSAATPTTTPTPNLSKQLLQEITQAAKKMEEGRRKREGKPKEEKIRIQAERFEDDSSVAETSDSDTEMVGYEVCRPPLGGGLQAKRSVSDIMVYNDDDDHDNEDDDDESSHCSDEEEVSENTTEEVDDPSSVYVDDAIPHQLSVIFEESERTDSAARYARESSVATTISEDTETIENSDEDEAAESDGTVLVKLPLTFKFSVAESQKVATLTVGTSEVQPQSAVQEVYDNLDTRADSLSKMDRRSARHASSNGYQTAESDGEAFYNAHGQDEDDVDWWGEISNSDDLPKAAREEESESEATVITRDIGRSSDEESVDFWDKIDKDDVYAKGARPEQRLPTIPQEGETETWPPAAPIETPSEHDLINQQAMENMETVMASIINTINSRTSAPCSDEERCEEVDFWAEIMDPQAAIQIAVPPQPTIGTGSACSSDSSLSSSQVPEQKEEELQPDQGSDVKPLSVHDRIRALQEAATYKQTMMPEEETDAKVSVKNRISAMEDPSAHKKSISRKSSVKSYEEFSEEEEGDSGVTSDVSRHISETDTEPDFLEVKRIQYQRASTHSRLFKLLQDECDSEDAPDDSKEEAPVESMQSRREHLNLPLQKNGSDPESFSSSGFTSPGSPTVNDRLVNELIQSLLRRKQGRVFKHMTMEKVQAAALRILQEDMDGLETLSSSEDGGSFLSPKKPGTGSSTPARTPQEFFNDYAQYYESWAQAEKLYDAQCDILPSKAFRLIQEHAAANRTGAVAGLLARCPRVLSNKNVQKELMKLIEGHGNPSPSPDPPDQPPDASEATSAS